MIAPTWFVWKNESLEIYLELSLKLSYSLLILDIQSVIRSLYVEKCLVLFTITKCKKRTKQKALLVIHNVEFMDYCCQTVALM